MKATTASLCVVLCSAPLFAFNSRNPFDITADTLEYTDADKSITATGHAVVVQDSSTLKADTLRYDRVRRRLFAQGHVFLSDKGSMMMGDTLDYDLLAESGTVTNALGVHSPWTFSGAAWQKQQDHLAGRDVSFTSCDLPDPHYRIRSSRIHLLPDRHFWAWNNLAYTDTLPMFYSPFVYKSLAPRRIVTKFQPGHDEANGNFVKTLTTLRFTDHVYDRVYYDHYTKQGNGFGNEFNYASSGQWRGSLFGYFINPRGNPELAGAPDVAQYNVRSYHWQRLAPSLTLQSNVNLRKNVSFNNQYFPQDINQAVNDITSSIALTHQKGPINQRLVLERLDAPDSGDTSAFAATHVQNATYPRYDFTLYQIPLWKPGGEALTPGTTDTAMLSPTPPGRLGPLQLNANATFGNTYQRLDDRYHPNASGAFTLSETIQIFRDLSLTPTLTPRVRWQDKFDARPPPPAGSSVPVSTVGLFRGTQGRIGTAETLRWRMLSSLTLDQTYSLTARMEPNKVGLDRRPADGGIETHHLNWLAFWRPSFRTLLRSFSGYDIRQIENETLTTYRQRKWDPWTTDLTYQPTPRTEYFLRYSLGYDPFKSQLWEGTYRFKGSYKTLLETGLLYNKGRRGTLTWNNRLGIYFSPSWRVDADLYALVPNTSLRDVLKQGTLINEKITVTRDMHCWQARFIYRNTPPLFRSYSLMFDLKLGLSAEKEMTQEDLETQYYPWRARTPL